MLVDSEILNQENIVIVFGQTECNHIIYNHLCGDVFDNQNQYSSQMLKIFNEVAYSFLDNNMDKEVIFTNFQRLHYLINNFSNFKILLIIDENDFSNFENLENTLNKFLIFFPNCMEYLDSISSVFVNCNFKNESHYTKSILKNFYESCSKLNLKNFVEKLIQNNNFIKINSFEEMSYINLMV